MKAVNDYIVVDKEKIGPKKIGGLILTEDLDEDNRYIKATIISTGNLIEGLKDGDVVHYVNQKKQKWKTKKCYSFVRKLMRLITMG